MSECIWVWDRPLEPERDTDVFVSRASDVQRILDLFVRGEKCVFFSSPPKSGTTTFFAELRRAAETDVGWGVHVFDARKPLSDQPTEAVRTDNRRTLVVVDELEDLQTADEVETLLQRLADKVSPTLGWVLAGDNRTRKSVKRLKLFPGPEEFQLVPLPLEAIADKLVVQPFEKLKYRLHPEEANRLCEAAANPYLVQRVAEALWRNIRRRGGSEFGSTEIRAFLANLGHLAKDYFDDLTERILRDDEAPYAIVDLLDTGLREESRSLQGLGIAGPDGRSFVSRPFEHALRERCSAKEFARRFGAAGHWAEAVRFYQVELARWTGPTPEKIAILEEAVNACFAARDPLDFVALSGKLIAEKQADERANWLQESFLPQLVTLIDLLPPKESRRIFETVVGAIDAVTRTGRVRLYLVDNRGERLLCRAATGVFADDFRKEPVSLQAGDWKVAGVYSTGQFVDVTDPQREEGCKRSVASAFQLQSSWLFPVFEPRSPGTDNEKQVRTVGVLCVDDPHHSSDRPGSAERDVIASLLRIMAGPLVNAKAEADRSDLQFRIERLASLHRHLLSDHPASKILEDLFQIATELQTNLSMIVVRLLEGFHLNRFGLAGYWPKDTLMPVFQREDLDRISEADSFADPKDTRTIRYIYDVRDPKQRQCMTALGRLMKAVEGANIVLPLGSLLSFRLETPEKYLGMCNFYTNHPYQFSDEEKEVLLMIVKQAAVALYNSQQIRSVKRQHEALTILSDCIALVNQKAGPQALERQITRRFANLFEVSSASFISMHKETGTLRVDYTFPEEEVIGEARRVFSVSEGVTGWAIQSGCTRVVSRKDDEWEKHIEQVRDIKCCAAVPMKDGGGNVIGAFALETRTEDAFTPDDVQLIETVVSQVPVAVTNAQLMCDLQQAYAELESRRWNEAMEDSVAAAVHRVGNIVSGIPTIARECMRQLKSGSADLGTIIADLELIQKSGERMQAIAKRLARSGAKAKDLQDVELVERIRRSIASLMLSPSPVNFILTGLGVYNFRSDVEKLDEILLCLFENAARATADAVEKDQSRPATVTVNIAGAEGGGVVVEISDSGGGISPRIDKKGLLRSIVDSNWGGNGIGLFTSYRQAIKLGGSIELASSTESGATFRLTMPTSPPVHVQVRREETND